jgi:hypothetical protein
MATRMQEARRSLGPSPPVSPTGDKSRAGGFGGETGSGQIGAVCGKSSPARKPGS